MSSGSLIIYAFKTSLENIKTIFDVPTDLTHHEDILDHCEDLLSDYDILDIFGLSCCYFNDKYIFIGTLLGTVFPFKSRNDIETFQTISQYHKNLSNKIEMVEEHFQKKQNLIESEIDELFKEFPLIEQFLQKSSISFYSIPNNCNLCL
jgi:hypothetical protein